MTRVVARPLKHDSADKHVAGSARYIDDLPEPEGCLHGALHLATITHGRILSIDVSAARALPGVVDIITVADVPGDAGSVPPILAMP